MEELLCHLLKKRQAQSHNLPPTQVQNYIALGHFAIKLSSYALEQGQNIQTQLAIIYSTTNYPYKKT